MTKAKKQNNYLMVGITLGVVAFLLLGTTATAQYSLMDRLADKAGEILGLKLAKDIDIGELSLGASAGPDHYFHNRFVSNLSIGGQYYATSSTKSALTLTTTELSKERDDALISWTVNVNTTLTTMASTSAPFRDLDVGEFYTVYFYNASTTAGATATFAAGTGVDLQEDEGETVIVNGLEIARLTFLKKADTDIMMWIEVGQVGD